MIDSFQIVVRLFRNPTSYRMTVEIMSHTDQIIKFRISAGEKSFEMDKLIVRKRNQWKVRRISFTSNYSIETQAEAIMAIQSEIDNYLKANYPKGLV